MGAERLTGVLRRWLPAGGGLRDEDWAGRHRLLTLLLASCLVFLFAFGAYRDRLDRAWLVSSVIILLCVLAAVRLRPRRLPSIFVALGLTAVCASFVAMCDGLTEAHFSFFIAVAALALYRDWAPFGAFLAATILHHALAGALLSNRTYDHHEAMDHPWRWSLLHGLAVLLAAAFQVVSWRLAEAEEHRAAGTLEASEAQLDAAFSETPVPMAMILPDGSFQRTNSAWGDWLGLPTPLPAGFGVPDLPITALGQVTGSIFGKLLGEGGTGVFVQQYQRHDDGSYIWVEVLANGIRDRFGRLRMVFIQAQDVTRQQEHEAELQRKVREDALTGLLSRAAFEEDLAALLASGAGPAGVVYLDVDRFKAINDGSGHAVGDQVLQALAERITELVPAGSLVARLGGDEFVVALPGSPETGLAGARILQASFGRPLPVAGNRLQLSASLGFAVAYGVADAENAVLAADTAMYAAKRAGGNRLEVFNEQMRTAVRERIVSEALLREALAGDLEVTLPVWFQPIVSPATGLISGAEALVRMRTADGRLLAPGHFISAAEETGLVVPLGEHVLAAALRHLVHWQDDLGYVSVNVSPRQLAEEGFVPALAAVLERSGLADPSRLVLEITETAVLSNSLDLRLRLEAIKALGVRIALDDFGTGYSSLTWLESVPADIVKLDRSFVAGLAHDRRKASIISAVLWLAQSLSMSVVAEGVEELDDWTALREAGCPAIQGYFFSRPVPPADFAALLWNTNVALAVPLPPESRIGAGAG